MIISFIIPFYNEQDSLYKTLLSIDKQIINDIKAEVFLVNGMSTDGSEKIAKQFKKNNSNKNIRFIVLKNVYRKTPFAFNIGIEKAKGEIIGFGGAHTIYPPDYFQNVINILNEIDADVVGGGHCKYLPDKYTIIGMSMSCLYMSPIGSGVAKYHRFKKPAYVDTVYGGFYKKYIFADIGKFNNKLIKNQDNELNARVLSAGYKIYFHPKLSTDYIIKTKISYFLKRAYSFGRYHFQTWKNNPKAFRIRHLIPGLLASYFVLMLISLHFSFYIICIPFLLYIFLLILNSLFFINKVGFLSGTLTIPIFFLFHLFYGFGVIVGSKELIKAEKK